MNSIEGLNTIFKNVSVRTGYQLGFDTHYDAQNFELSEIRGRSKYRLDFQPLEGGTMQVTRLVETYPVSPKMCLFLQSFFPFFTFGGKINWEAVENINLNEPAIELEQRIEEIVQNAM